MNNMCGRFSVDDRNPEIMEMIEALPADHLPIKTGEVFPANGALTLINKDRKITPEAMIWGFTRYDGKGIIINARAESALAKPLFKNSLLKNPLVIPVSGFFEWEKIKDDITRQEKKVKYLFKDADNEISYLAGLWNVFENKEGRALPYFTILTTDANKEMLPYHNRMPVMLRKNEISEWLDGKNRAEILAREPFILHAQMA